MQEKEDDVAWIGCGFLCKSRLSIFDGVNNGIPNFDKLSTLEPSPPMGNPSAGCTRGHTSEEKTIVRLRKAESGCTMFRQVVFANIYAFVERIEIWIG